MPKPYGDPILAFRVPRPLLKALKELAEERADETGEAYTVSRLAREIVQRHADEMKRKPKGRGT